MTTPIALTPPQTLERSSTIGPTFDLLGPAIAPTAVSLSVTLPMDGMFMGTQWVLPHTMAMRSQPDAENRVDQVGRCDVALASSAGLSQDSCASAVNTIAK